MKSKPRYKWRDPEDYDALGIAVITAIYDGQTVVDGCERFLKERPETTLGTTKIKWHTVVSKRMKEEYDEALRFKNQLNPSTGKANDDVAPTETDSVEVIKSVIKSDDTIVNNKVITILESVRTTGKLQQRDLIRLLRNVDIETEETQELESLRMALADMKRDYDALQNRFIEMQAKYNDLKVEHDIFIRAFNVARKQATGMDKLDEKIALVEVG